METELKLRFNRPADQEKFMKDPWFHQLAMPDSRVETEMLSRYYDTPNHALTRTRTSLRIREEGEIKIATIKLGGQVSNGLHQRQEWSVDLTDEDWADDPVDRLDINWFQKYAVSDGDPDEHLRDVLQLIEGQPLVEICQARFRRIAFDVGYGDTLMELALDSGTLSAGDNSDLVSELELELKEGDVRDLMALGEEIMARFGLIPESLSKYARCLILLQRQGPLDD